MNEKKRIEKITAELFLELYNPRFGTAFEIEKLGETPDVNCIDSKNGDLLELEISLLENLSGEVQHILGRGPKPTSPTTGTTVVSFFNDTADKLRSSLKKKLLSSYDPNTALVLRQVSIIWEPKDWELVADVFRKEVLSGKEVNFGSGVWIICTDNTTWPASDTLFCLSKPRERQGK